MRRLLGDQFEFSQRFFNNDYGRRRLFLGMLVVDNGQGRNWWTFGRWLVDDSLFIRIVVDD